MRLKICLYALLSTSVNLVLTQGSNVSTAAAGLNGKLPNVIPSDFFFSGNVHTYYIQAEQDTWDYVSTDWDNWLVVPLNASTRAYSAGYTTALGSLGTKWQKALYRGYTDAAFNQLIEQPSWQGINGPTLRAEHAFYGLVLLKGQWGQSLPNTTTGQQTTPIASDAVAPGQCVVYKWLVDDGTAPYPGTNSQMWSYHSYVNMVVDLDTGLAGPTIVYNKGTMNQTIASHHEFVLLYETFDESMNFLAAFNLRVYNASSTTMAVPVTLEQNYAGNISYWKPQLTNMPTVSLSTTQTPSFYTLKGWVLANSPPFEICTDEKVIWYVYAFGDASHVFHMHRNGFKYHGNNMASKSLNDSNMMTL